MRLNLDEVIRTARPRPKPKVRLLTMHAWWGWQMRIYDAGTRRLVATAMSDPDITWEPLETDHPIIQSLSALAPKARNQILAGLVDDNLPHW